MNFYLFCDSITIMDNKPLLSVCVMFKNEIRTLERCLSSAAYLQNVLPCEIIAADTGSTDGSRAIAELYSDIVIDVLWTDDFSAARNAMLDVVSGEWCLMLDADEWFDENLSDLTVFLSSPPAEISCVFIIRRDYHTASFDDWSDVAIGRLLRMSDKPRYNGIIHEEPCFEYSRIPFTGILGHPLIHHDGYVDMNDSSNGISKTERNIRLLRKKLSTDPDNLLTLLQFFDVAMSEPDYESELIRAMKLVEGHKEDWEFWGQVIFRDAVQYAAERKLSVMYEWALRAKELFPYSYYIQLDVNYLLFASFNNTGDTENARKYGKIYLAVWDTLQNDEKVQLESGLGGYNWDSPAAREDVLRVLNSL